MGRTVERCGLLLLIAGFSTASAAAQSIPGPLFDPTPLSIPPVNSATTRAVTAMDLVTIRDPKGLSLSPDGKYVAFVVSQAVYETNSYRTAMYIVSTHPGAVPRNLGSAGLPHWDEINQWLPEAPEWSPDSSMVTCRMRRSSRETLQVWAWDLKSRTPKRLTHAAGDVESYSWFPGEFRLFLAVKKRDDPAEYKKSRETSVLYDGSFRPWEGSPIREAIRKVLPAKYGYWTYDLKRNIERPAETEEIRLFVPTIPEHGDRTRGAPPIAESRSILEGKASPDGKNVAFLYAVTDSRASKIREQRLFVERLDGGLQIEVTPDAFYVDQYWWSPDSQRIYYSERRGDGHSPRLMVYSIADQSTQTVFAAEFGDYFTEFAVDSVSSLVACLRERNTSPPEIVLIEVSTGSVRSLVDLNPEFRNLSLAPATRMEGTNSYGDAWHGYLVRPSNYVVGKRYPLIVTTYRSGDYFLRGASGDESPVQVYAAHGFAVLCFDVGKPKNTLPGDFEAKLLDWASPAASMEMAIQELAGSGLIDPERVGITGFSHGEEIVGYMVTHSKSFRAAVGAAGYDPSFYYIGGNRWQQLFEQWGLGGWPGGKSRQHWEEIALSLRADRVDVPILEVASDSEYITYLSKVVSLQELGKPVELYIYPNELHIRNQPKFKYEIYVRNVDWFRFWLNGEEDLSPSRVEQTRRWMRLRERSQRHEAPPGPTSDRK